MVNDNLPAGIPEARVYPRISEVEAVRLGREIYGLDAKAQSLPGEYDDNFQLTTPDGRAFVLKLMHEAREESFIEMQCHALQHLARRAPELALPRVCTRPDGKAFSKAKLAHGQERYVWLLTYISGTVLAKAIPKNPELLRSLGRLLGKMDTALRDFSHPATKRELKWDLTRAGWIRDYLHCVEDSSRRAIVERFLALYDRDAIPEFQRLRKSVIYGDANDYNALVGSAWPQPREVTSVIDFGDMHFGAIISEAAIAAAYAVLGKNNPLEAACALVEGFHSACPLDDLELSVLFPLIAARLAVSVVNSAHRKKLVPDDPYVTITESPAWDALDRLAKIHPRFAHYTFRHACGMEPVPSERNMERWLLENGKSASSLLDLDLRTEPCAVLDLSVGSSFLGANPQQAEPTTLTDAITGEMKRNNVSVCLGRHNEARLPHAVSLLPEKSRPTDEYPTVHLGIDLFVEPGTAVRAPLAGSVQTLANDNAQPDCGAVVILRHAREGGKEFFTLYARLTKDTLATLRVGQIIKKGQPFGRVGTIQENGGCAPHLHFQIIADLLELDRGFPNLVRASERAVWASLSPDPNLLLGIPSSRFPVKAPSSAETLIVRKTLLGRNLSISYDHPLKIVRGWRQYLYDDTGRAYLDVYNNVPLVGHSHPRVVRAAQDQLGVLNTNTRYLHDNIVRYAKRLTRHMPESLRVCYFLNSGSEANELALRLARTHTGREDIIVLEHAYHGHTTTLTDISPYKFNGPGGRGCKPWVHVAPIPDDYRGKYKRGEPGLGEKYAGHIFEILERMRTGHNGVAAYIAETMPSVAGQIVFPPGYLAEAYRHVREAGGVCIADEVQVGFGRLGTHFWGFETQGVVPDIVVLGKPIGNGFPLAAVVTTPEIAASFANGMEFFSTFGGNPVSTAVGLAVLDVLEEENLQENALRVGNGLIARLKALQDRHALIGDVRGLGLFLGLDLVRDRTTREPATDEASYISNRLRDCGILTGTDGPHHNVIKLRPPLIFSEDDADLFVAVLDSVLREDAAQPRLE